MSSDKTMVATCSSFGEACVAACEQPILDARCFVGGPAVGKSTALAAHARALAASGEQSVLVVCATPMGCAQMRKLLGCEGNGVKPLASFESAVAQGQAPGVMSGVQVLTARDVALEIMSDPAAVKRFGRGPRVLDSTEASVFFEDMKSCGLKRRRLRELLVFLYRGWSDLADDNPDWIQTTEEEACIALVRENLAFTGGILEVELANLALSALREDADLANRYRRNHVLVDDYCLIGRASQKLAGLVACRSLIIAADDAPALPVFDPYPYAEGLVEFRATYPHAVVERLADCYRPASIVEILNRLRADDALGGMPLKAVGDAESAAFETIDDKVDKLPLELCEPIEDYPAVEVRMEPSLVEECRALCELVQQENARDILVVGTNAVWRANVARAMESCGVSVQRLAVGGGLGGVVRSLDFCDADRNARAMSGAIERLACDENDSIAWRTWCSFGDALARSASVARLRRAVAPYGLSFAEALRRLEAGDLEGVCPDEPLLAPLVLAYREGLVAVRDFKQEAAERRDDSGRCGCAEGLDATAPSIAATAASVAAATDKQEGSEQRRVLIGAPADVFGYTADVVVFGGFVNGFIPSRDYCDPGKVVGTARLREHQANLQTLQRCAACARKRLVFTGFTSCGLEVGERLNLRIARIRLRDGVRTCTIEPSNLLSFVE